MLLYTQDKKLKEELKMKQILNTLKTKYEANREEFVNTWKEWKEIRAEKETLALTRDERNKLSEASRKMSILEGEAKGLSFAFNEIVKSMGLSIIPKTIITIEKEGSTTTFADNVVVETNSTGFIKGETYSSVFIIGYVADNKYKMEVEREEISIEKWVIPK